MIVGQKEDIDALLTRRKNLSDAGLSTAPIDQKLADLGYSPTGAGKAKSAASLQVEGKANAGLKAIQDMETLIQSDAGVVFASHTPMIEMFKGQSRKQYEAAVSSLTDAIGGLRTGASVSKEQQQFYADMLPKPGDSPETIRVKMAAVKRELGGYLNQNVTETTAQQ